MKKIIICVCIAAVIATNSITVFAAGNGEKGKNAFIQNHPQIVSRIKARIETIKENFLQKKQEFQIKKEEFISSLSDEQKIQLEEYKAIRAEYRSRAQSLKEEYKIAAEQNDTLIMDRIKTDALALRKEILISAAEFKEFLRENGVDVSGLTLKRMKEERIARAKLNVFRNSDHKLALIFKYLKNSK